MFIIGLCVTEEPQTYKRKKYLMYHNVSPQKLMFSGIFSDIRKWEMKPSMAVHTCNLSCRSRERQENHSLRPAWSKLIRCYLKTKYIQRDWRYVIHQEIIQVQFQVQAQNFFFLIPFLHVESLSECLEAAEASGVPCRAAGSWQPNPTTVKESHFNLVAVPGNVNKEHSEMCTPSSVALKQKGR